MVQVNRRKQEKEGEQVEVKIEMLYANKREYGRREKKVEEYIEMKDRDGIGCQNDTQESERRKQKDIKRSFSLI